MTPPHLLAAAIRARASAPGNLVPQAAIRWTLRELRRLVAPEVWWTRAREAAPAVTRHSV